MVECKRTGDVVGLRDLIPKASISRCRTTSMGNARVGYPTYHTRIHTGIGKPRHSPFPYERIWVLLCLFSSFTKPSKMPGLWLHRSNESRDISEEGIDESVLEEIVGKLINEAKLEKAESICTLDEPCNSRNNPHHHSRRPSCSGKQFNLEGKDLMIIRAMSAIAEGSAPISSLPQSTFL